MKDCLLIDTKIIDDIEKIITIQKSFYHKFYSIFGF